MDIGIDIRFRLASMRLFRPRKLFHVIFLLLVLLPISGACGAQAPANTAPQAATPDSLDAWGPMRSQVRDLASKIGAAIGPSGHTPLAFTFANLSSLDADDAATISELLKAQLIERKLSFSDSDNPVANLHITLTQGIDGYLVVAEFPPGTGKSAVIELLTVPAQLLAHQSGGISLEEKLVWEQPERILDFALWPAGQASAKLVILETKQLDFYTQEANNWQPVRKISIAPARSERDIRGAIAISEDAAQAKAVLPDVECDGDFAHPETVNCGNAGQRIEELPKDAKLDALGGDATFLTCAGHTIALVTGDGDWTHPDVIRAYEKDGQDYRASSSPLQFVGPVISLTSVGSQNAARAVVHNLETGNYEAYLVTATCSH